MLPFILTAKSCFFLQVHLFTGHVNKIFSEKHQSPCHHQKPWIFSSFASTSFSLARAAVVVKAGPPAGAASAPVAGPPTPTLQTRLPVLTLALCKQVRPERFSIDASCTNEGIDLILHDHHLAIVEDEGRVDIGELRGGGHVVDGWHSASCWMEWGPHPIVASGSLEGPSTVAAVEEKAQTVHKAKSEANVSALYSINIYFPTPTQWD